MMHKFLALFSLFLTMQTVHAQDGYEIKVKLTPLKNQYIYFANYQEDKFPLIDSALLNAKSEAVFKGDKKLGGGIYVIVLPEKNRSLEFIIDQDRYFSLEVDTTNLQKVKFKDSKENLLFQQYTTEMAKRGREIDSLKKNRPTTINEKDSIALAKVLKSKVEDLIKYRKEIAKDDPNSLMYLLVQIMNDVEIPPAAAHPGGVYDTAYAYQYLKDHYWDNINLWDDRIIRTPRALFSNKVENYFNNYVYPAPDSVIKQIDWMMGFASPSKEVSQYLLLKFLNRYYRMKYMWEDAVFVHLYQNYIYNKEYEWLNAEGRKQVSERAYSLMANILGKNAENIVLPNLEGKSQSLYEIVSPFTLVVFYDPNCGHCQEVLPKIDSAYVGGLKEKGLAIYAVSKEIDASEFTWKKFVTTHNLGSWNHVYYSKETEKARVENQIPSYTQLYDVQTYPTIFLLDKDKKIIGKKMGVEQIATIMDYKLKSGN